MEKAPVCPGINHPNPVALCGTRASWDGFVKIQVTRIPATRLDEFWPTASRFIYSAFRAEACEPLEEIYENIVEGNYQLWAVFAGEMICAVVTMLVDGGEDRVLHVEYGGAEWQSLGLWKGPLVELLTSFAKHYDAKALTCAGRPGWLRVFPGAKRQGKLMRKEI